MVFFFTSRISGEEYSIYMGIDKHENETLIKYGWPEDVWFHVDKLSSAHVYLRLKKDQSIEDVPTSVVMDCAQLVKANSITGNKTNNLNVVYTPWANLKKTGDMAVGQIGFHKQKKVRSVFVEKRINETVNRLNKTKVERFPDLQQEKEERDREERNESKKKYKEQVKKEKEEKEKKLEEKKLKSYSSMFEDAVYETNKCSNQDNSGSDSDDFM